MPSFADCIMSAVRQGDISQNAGDDLIDRYEQHRKASHEAGEVDPEAAAKERTAKQFDEEAALKRKQAVLAEASRDQIRAYGETYRDTGTKKPDIGAAYANKIENHGAGAGTSSFAGTAASKFGLAIGKIEDFASEFRRSRLTGARFNKPAGEEMIAAIYGKTTSPEAKALADAVTNLNEDLRLEFNEKGGNIGKLDGPWLPQDHNPAAVLNAGRSRWSRLNPLGKWTSDEAFKNWKADTVPKLDMDRVRDPLTGGKLEGARLDEVMRRAFDNIITDGWADRKPSGQPQGRGALANQRQEHRFLHFKSAEDWIAYNRDYGGGDPVAAILKHVRGMTTDIAAMETFGPNPSATLEWMKQGIASEAAKFVAGRPSLYRETALGKAQDAIKYGPSKLQAIYDAAAGAPVASKRIAAFVGDVRNVLSSAQLGGASILAAAQDPFIDAAARHASGIPAARAMGVILKTFSADTRETAVRAGLGLDEFNHVMGTEARYAGVLGGHEITKWLVERTVNWNGLEPITQARKHRFGVDFMGAVADRRNMSFEELGNEFPLMRRTFEGYGLEGKDWDKIRTVDPTQPAPGSAPILQASDVANADRRLGERYLEMILQQTENAVPTSNARSKAFATLGFNRGTVGGELAASFLQYKSFSLSFMASQWQQMMMQARAGSVTGASMAGGAMVVRGAAYAASLLTTMTMAGAAALQFKNLANGKDLQSMDLKFWIQALQYGGGLGLAGDFLLADVNRFGQTPLESALGPVYGLGKDLTETLILNPGRAIRGEKTKVGRDVVNMLGRYTPIASSLFYTRAAYRRMVLDQLQFLADPDAHTHFRQQEQSLHRETGQGFFWRPGQTLPERAPVMSPAKQ